MKLFLGAAAISLCLSRLAFAQPESRPQFDAVDVHVMPQTTIRVMRGNQLHGTRFEIHNASMLDLIRTAYNLDADKVLGGPSWLEMDRFDVIAKAPANSLPDTLHLMLQSMLADRFQLAVRQEARPLPAFALTAGKRQGLKEADPAGESGCRMSLEIPPDARDAQGPVTLTRVSTCHNMTMANFAESLKGQVQGTAPVINQTELNGAWDFTYKFSMAGRGGSTDGISIFEAVDKQLGLKLERISPPQAVAIVDSVNRVPTPNPPEVARVFPPLPTEFDVAEIKPGDPNSPVSAIMVGGGGVMMVAARGGGGRGVAMGGPLQNGRLNLQGYSLSNLIMLAWDIRFFDSMVGLPKFADTDKYDVIAKVPSGTENAFTDMDSIRPLLRNLLIDKFQIKFHNEDRPMTGFVLTAAKPKMAKADPAGRTKYMEGPGPDGKDPRVSNPALSRLVYCTDMTMAQFADLLPSIAGGYIQGGRVLDKTGLEGAWDFTLSFSPAGGGGGRGADVGGVATAADPSGGMTLFDAISKQLGLKLETQKVPLPAMVIDHIEQKPKEN